MAQLKLLIFLIALGLAAGCVSVAWWIWDKELRHEMAVQQDTKLIRSAATGLPDPGARRFDAALDLIRQGQHEAGRDALYKLLQQFPESPTCAEAMRIIGEMNLDSLFSPNQMVGKKDYIVQPGDSLALIANKNETTVDTLTRMNGLLGTVLHPGDHLIVVPLKFDVVVDVSKKSVTLLRNVTSGKYKFKEYSAFDVRLPPNLRVPADMEIGIKQAVVDGKAVVATDQRYIDAEKWLIGTKAGVSFRTVPVARALVVSDVPKAQPAGLPDDPAAEPAAETGIFLSREDLEELFALVRKGSKLTIVR